MELETACTKIGDLKTTIERVRALQGRGQRIVHCHGEFDRLHVEDILHLRQARAMGDVLIVTVTPDPKADPQKVGQVTLPQTLRAELVAAVEVVDYVAVSESPSAADTIRTIRSNVFAKTIKTRDHGFELSASIVEEQEAARAAGSQLRFTKAPKQLTGYLECFPPEVNNHLDSLRERFSTAEILRHVEALRDMEVVLVGETILDEYVYCDALGKSGKEPVLAMRYVCKERHAGGVLAIANHLANFCGKVTLVSYLGEDDTQEDFIRQHLNAKVNATFVNKADSPTIIKRRFLDNYSRSKMFAVYELSDEALSASEENDLCAVLEQALPKADVAVVADFGHGLVTDPMIDLLSRESKYLCVNTQLNAANVGYHTISKYPKADYISIHEGELRLDARCRKGELRGLISNLAERLQAKMVMVTRGKHGSLLFDSASGFHVSPAFATKIVDRIGAGDAVFSMTSLCAARGVPPALVNFLGNLVGAQAVSVVGNREPVDRRRLAQTIDNLLNPFQTQAA
ncbi:MAG TPA: PfkB family carbohydrate kinase [Pirellulales bacterium]|jgi:rfaE bifunctional protein kinase chain/domain|nr:PfkB family carbohydrate kinase [Pirellulales bacterium]